jgi:NAD(P)-dependent dehydrogenase (short-subunit alcohol dehydrogenase family)
MANNVLAERTVVISGGSRGIGLAIGIAAAGQGANVVLLAKTDAPHPRLPGTVHTAAADVEAAGGKALAVVGDVRREEDVQRVVEAAVQRFGGIDVCVNNASAIAVEPPRCRRRSLAASSRSPEVMADAAVEIISRPAREATGHIDAEVLQCIGISDLSRYGGGEQPIPDLFLD